MKENLKATLKNVYTLLMGILVVLAVMTLFGLATGIRLRILTTDSMFPSLYRGSLILIDTDFAWEDLDKRDVIAFRSGSTEVMHRVTAVTEEGLVLKPDNGEGENLVSKDMYVGKEVVAFPFIGDMNKSILRNGKGVVCIAAMALIVAGCRGGKKK